MDSLHDFLGPLQLLVFECTHVADVPLCEVKKTLDIASGLGVLHQTDVKVGRRRHRATLMGGQTTDPEHACLGCILRLFYYLYR
jgi:hypothetical protein